VTEPLDIDERRRRALAVRQRFGELAELTRLAPRRERKLAEDELFAIYPAWRRAEEELNELDYPQGPDLTLWTVDALRGIEPNIHAYLGSAFHADIERVRRGNRGALESVIRYLEADPWFPGTGWEKEKILRFLRRIDIEGYEERLREVVITVVQSGHPRRELYLYRRLSHRVMNDELRSALEALADDTDKPSGLARYVLRADQAQ